MTAVIEAEATETVEAPAEEKAEPKQRGRKPESRDWTEVKEDHVSFANYINEKTGLGITPGQVKATFLLRGEWTNTPERVAEREAAAAATAEEKAAKAEAKRIRDEEKAKYANESEEEKAARKEREKAIKAADRATKRAEELQAKADELKRQAAIETDSTEPDAEAEFESVANDAEVEFSDVTETPAEVEVEEVEFKEAEAKPTRRPRKRNG